MSSRHQPAHGADSACTACQSSIPHAFLVKMWADDGGPFDLMVPAAIGPADARSQARYLADEAGDHDAAPVRVEHAGGMSDRPILRCDCCSKLRPCIVLLLEEWGYVTYRCTECEEPHALHEEAA